MFQDGTQFQCGTLLFDPKPKKSRKELFNRTEELGVLRDFIGTDNPGSMLCGRYTKEINVERFSREQSIQFLKEGFRERGVTPSQEVLEEAVSVFDGIVGWPVYYGKKRKHR